MSVNKYMHPRNIYKVPPDFKQLALMYPEFKSYVKLDVAGKVVFDFKNPEALRALSTILLKKDFDLHVEIPVNKLIPTIPLRLNYILWIEDLLDYIKQDLNSIKGIDIGTGASCVYPLIIAKKNKWNMIATESDAESVRYAEKNVTENNLSPLIKVVQVTDSFLLKGLPIANDEVYHFCMCNPPFFATTEELHPFFKSRNPNRPRPKNAFVATTHEVVSKGGEIEFISKIINESTILKEKIMLYTTMIGQKCNLPALKKLLREANVNSFKETEFCQGNTTRWGLAWTYLNYDLHKAPDILKLIKKGIKSHAPLIYEIPHDNMNIEEVNRVILEMLEKLKMSVEDVTRNKQNVRYFVNAYSNTWSHQRRQKRAEKMKQLHCDDLMLTDESDQIKEETYAGKRSWDDEICQSTYKKLRITENDAEGVVYFRFMLALHFENAQIYLELNTVKDNDNREYLNQILQYIKNNFKSSTEAKNNNASACT